MLASEFRQRTLPASWQRRQSNKAAPSTGFRLFRGKRSFWKTDWAGGCGCREVIRASDEQFSNAPCAPIPRHSDQVPESKSFLQGLETSNSTILRLSAGITFYLDAREARVRFILRFIIGMTILVRLDSAEAGMPTNPHLEASFRLMYELGFDAARARLGFCRQADPEDSLCAAAEAASYLFEEFSQKGVLTSAFFLDDERLLGGIEGSPDKERNAAFLAANQRARKMAEVRLVTMPQHPGALLTLALTDGMQGDFEALIMKRQLQSLKFIRRAEKEANALLRVEPDNGDAFVALGSANYIIGCMPAYKRFVLWFGGIHGDRQIGMEQLQMAATRGHYLRPLAKTMLALAAEREHQFDLARSLFADLHGEFPDNPVFAHELSLLNSR
jgi:hypothetical protein